MDEIHIYFAACFNLFFPVYVLISQINYFGDKNIMLSILVSCLDSKDDHGWSHVHLYSDQIFLLLDKLRSVHCSTFAFIFTTNAAGCSDHTSCIVY